ncbi:MAG: septal ring lytic transglycosylase RlpA family protein [Thermoleophilia bacterium]|nr:septal ring lytic transglycosylase RlpA family protein [Thermoleophilia bacterium]
MRIFLLAILSVFFCFLIAVSSAGAENSSQDIADRIASDRKNLENARLELAQIDGKLANAEVYLNQRRVELADATARLNNAEDRYNQTLLTYEGRISAIYKLGESNFYDVALSSEDFADSLARLSYLGKVSENDERLVRRVKGEADAVREARERVDGLKQDQAFDTNALKSRKLELENQLATGKTAMDRQMVELNQARNREDQEELRRVAEESASIDAGSIYNGVMGPSVVVSNDPPPGLNATGIALSGMASWYGPGFQGNTTANGEIYNMYGFTAAHKSLPFNTWLKVTHNGRSVFVRINDRGPYVGGRILDLSYSSAQAIGITGVGFVSAEIYR